MINDKHRRQFLWEMAMGFGIVCAGRTLTWAGSTANNALRRRTPNGDWLETVPPGHLPSCALDKSKKVQEAYQYAAAVRQDMTQGSQLGMNSTPSFFVNGRFLSGAQPFSAFQALIDDVLASK